MAVSRSELEQLLEYAEALRARLKLLLEEQRDEEERVRRLGEPSPRLSRIV